MSAAQRDRPIRWLHLSDLHLGCPGESLWAQVHQEFQAGLKKQVKRVGVPDLVLFTGDLAFQGDKKEYERVDRFLEDLKKWLSEAGAEKEPLILPVPGNHDLKRPKKGAYEYLILDQYNNDDPRVLDFRKKLWSNKAVPSLIKKPFKAYVDWFKKTIKPQFDGTKHEFHESRFPGDYSVELNLWDNTPLIVVGLNSAWMQYCDEMGRTRLELPLEQFNQALPKKNGKQSLAIFDNQPPALLMMHHPPDWFSPKSKQILHENIYPPSRFNAFLFGHMHDGCSQNMSAFGGEPHYYYQSPSLFGVKHYDTGKAIRSIGYSLGSIAPNGEIRLWPIERKERTNTSAVLVPDSRFPGAEKKEGFQIRPGQGERPEAKAKETKKQASTRTKKTTDFTLYLQTILDETDHINISGIAANTGVVKKASRYPIEKLYVPLSSHTLQKTQRMDGKLRLRESKGRSKTSSPKPMKGQSKTDPDPELLHTTMESREVLQNLLSRHHRLLIEGQPGSGKTTFLRFITCMLARDRLEIPCSAGETWRKKHLGMDSNTPAPVPVFLRLAHLVDLLKKNKSKPQRIDDRRWIIDLAFDYCKSNAIPLSRRDWQELL
ncbi:MAG: metallophosphoesterase, partial [Planctomycetes bacterium]|nr:metallophosphoesterase [Planctomycetota bacterium]